LGAIIDKHRRLDSLSSPKIIFVGGSATAFGLNCERIEKELNMPVVNMALHGRLGLFFMLNEVKPAIHKNDVVVIVLEYFRGPGNYKLQKHVMEIYPQVTNYFEISKIEWLSGEYDLLKSNLYDIVKQIQSNVVYGIPKHTTNYYDNDTNIIYRRNAFSVFGDMTAHWRKPKPSNWTEQPAMGEVKYEMYLNKLNDFADYVKSIGANVYLMYPPYAESHFKRLHKTIKTFENVLDTQLRIECINSPETFAYPDEYFFDTVYHLNKLGTEKRTTKTIEILSTILDSKSSINTQLTK